MYSQRMSMKNTAPGSTSIGFSKSDQGLLDVLTGTSLMMLRRSLASGEGMDVIVLTGAERTITRSGPRKPPSQQ